MLTWDRNMDNSSYSPSSFQWFWYMESPIFSKDWSSNSQEGEESSKPHCSRACTTSFRRNLQRDDFPMPVGMQIEIHNNTGSNQSVPSTSTTEWDMVKLTMSNNPAKTAVAGMLIAVPTWWQAYRKKKLHKNYALVNDMAMATSIQWYSFSPGSARPVKVPSWIPYSSICAVYHLAVASMPFALGHWRMDCHRPCSTTCMYLTDHVL